MRKIRILVELDDDAVFSSVTSAFIAMADDLTGIGRDKALPAPTEGRDDGAFDGVFYHWAEEREKTPETPRRRIRCEGCDKKFEGPFAAATSVDGPEYVLSPTRLTIQARSDEDGRWFCWKCTSESVRLDLLTGREKNPCDEPRLPVLPILPETDDEDLESEALDALDALDGEDEETRS